MSYLWWLISGAVLMVLELAIPGVFLCFLGAAAIVNGLIVWLLPECSLTIQLLVFAALSCALLWSCRHWIPRIFKGKILADESDVDSDAVAGAAAVVVETIRPDAPGIVEFRGTRWNAVSDREIAVGTQVKVKRRNNLVLEIE